MARFLVEVRAIGKPVSCFDLLMLSKQLPYVFRRALSQEARAGGAAVAPSDGSSFPAGGKDLTEGFKGAAAGGPA